MTLLTWTVSYGQLDKLTGTWITPSQDLMLITDTGDLKNNNYLSNSKLHDENFELYIYGDVLSFQKWYYSSATNYEKLYIDKYDLTILNRTDTSITVRPSSSFSKKFFDKRTSVTFIKQEFSRDKSIKLEKIIYHTTSCFGSCPTINLEIANDRTFYLEGEFYKDNSMYEMDSIKSGAFIGKLNDTLYNELINILQTCNLRTLIFPEVHGADAPVTTLIIYYNGQRKYLKSMFPPIIANKLIEFLYLVNERANLTRTNVKQKIEE